MHLVSSERIFWVLKSADILLVLINISEDIDELEEYIERLEIVSDIRSCFWEAEFIIIDWLSVSTAMKADIESVAEEVSTEHILVEGTEDC